MKSRLQCFATVTLFAALAIPVRLSAQEQKEVNHRYKLIDTGAAYQGSQSAGGQPDNRFASRGNKC
jgi:hypothetical protein